MGKAMKPLAMPFPQALVQLIDALADLCQTAVIQNGIISDDLREADVKQHPFADDRFDSVVILGVFFYIPNWPRAVEEMALLASYSILNSYTNVVVKICSDADLLNIVSHERFVNLCTI